MQTGKSCAQGSGDGRQELLGRARVAHRRPTVSEGGGEEGSGLDEELRCGRLAGRGAPISVRFADIVSRMESHGVAGAIQVTEAVQRRLEGQFDFEARGLVEVKGKGKVATWLLKGQVLSQSTAQAAAQVASSVH